MFGFKAKTPLTPDTLREAAQAQGFDEVGNSIWFGNTTSEAVVQVRVGDEWFNLLADSTGVAIYDAEACEPIGSTCTGPWDEAIVAAGERLTA
jgi:hypothetical protein